jgi:hypothetical protein
MKRTFGSVVIVAVCLAAITLLVVPAGAQETEKKVSIEQVPKKVREAILKQVGHGRLVDIGKFTGGKEVLYEIEMVVDGKEWDVLFAEDGTVRRRTFEGYKSGGPKKQPQQKNKKKKSSASSSSRMKAGKFQDFFDLENRELVSRGRSKYFILEPGYELVLEGPEGRHKVQLAVTVLPETKKIGNIVTRVVEERETVDGQLIEISRNFLAMCKQTGSVFYFGEEVDIYKNGKVIGHEGAWIHGRAGARAGMMMPGDPVLGASYYQEVAPKKAMDRGTIVDVNATLQTPAGTFTRCVKVREENPLDKEHEFKIHAPGVGLIQDEDLLLVRYGFVK